MTWNTQPGTGSTVTSATSGTGWRSWDVTGQVQAQLGGGEHGFQVRDQNESSGTTALTQTHVTRESPNDPQLVLTWVAAP